MIFRMVDLPAPLSPRRPTTSWGKICRFTFSRAQRPPKYIDTSLRSMSGSEAASGTAPIVVIEKDGSSGSADPRQQDTESVEPDVNEHRDNEDCTNHRLVQVAWSADNDQPRLEHAEDDSAEHRS